jgi:nucleotide-binding universal stress UspA family protein
MSYKTILVYLNSSKRAAATLDAALALAVRFDAHVIGLNVIPMVTVPAVVPFEVTGEIIEIQRKALEEESARIAAVFTEKTATYQKSEWRQIRASHYDIASIVDLHGRSVDLIVSGQSDPTGDIYQPADVTEDVMMEAGRPSLIVPSNWVPGDLGKRVVVAWNESREATRAVFDALPVLKAASSVWVISVNPPHGHRADPDLPGSEIATSLARHGVKCDATTSVARNIGVTDDLLARVAEHKADLLVMGGYGHSRLREVVFGGATRDMMQRMTVPVLMSH